MPELPAAQLQLHGTTAITVQRLYVLIDGERVGEIHASRANVEIEAGSAPVLVVHTFIRGTAANRVHSKVELTTPPEA